MLADGHPAQTPKATATPATPRTTRPRAVSPATAHLLSRGLVHNADLVDVFSAPLFGEAEDLAPYLTALEQMAGAVHAGDLRDAEGLLLAHAVTLNAIFARCARHAAAALDSQLLEATDRYMRLALKAQSQCRATVETLAIVKNPTTVFARQANIAQGPQQVNNVATVTTDGRDSASRARAEKFGANELLTDPLPEMPQ
jgi:hypothetical protein